MPDMKCGWCGYIQDVPTLDEECKQCGECEFVHIITPHKGDESGARVKRMEARLTANEKRNVKFLLQVRGMSLADYIMEKVNQDTHCPDCGGKLAYDESTDSDGYEQGWKCMYCYRQAQ